MMILCDSIASSGAIDALTEYENTNDDHQQITKLTTELHSLHGKIEWLEQQLSEIESSYEKEVNYEILITN